MKLWHIEAVVADHKLYDLMLYLEQIKAYNVKNTVFANGQDRTEEPKGQGRSGPRASRSNLPKQEDWLMENVPPEFLPSEIREAWIKKGYRKGSLYGALGRLVRNKQLKKMANGTYKKAGA